MIGGGSPLAVTRQCIDGRDFGGGVGFDCAGDCGSGGVAYRLGNGGDWWPVLFMVIAESPQSSGVLNVINTSIRFLD